MVGLSEYGVVSSEGGVEAGGRSRRDEAGLGGMLRGWRRAAGIREGRRRALTQAVVAERAGVSERWYRKLEKGESVRLDRGTLERLASALLLDQPARAALFLQAVQLLPVPSLEAQEDEVTYQGLRLMVAYVRAPAVLTTGAWDVVATNAAMEERFPWMSEPGANLAKGLPGIKSWLLAVGLVVLAWGD
ncbi:helix-turn-helix transcriptional regulator, partial [Streptomyces sedi]